MERTNIHLVKSFTKDKTNVIVVFLIEQILENSKNKMIEVFVTRCYIVF